MAHGLHILRRIEEKFGAIESYLFPRLTKPFTHFDVPVLTLEDKPNHAIGINDIGYLISPDSRDFSLARGLEMMKEAQDSVDTISEEGTISGSPIKPSTLKSRYAIRIAVSGINEYPQPFFSHKIINPREKTRIQQELASWKSAYEVFGSSAAPPSHSEIRPKTQTIEELLQENFNVPQNTLVLPQRGHTQEPERKENNGPEQAQQPAEHQLFKVHSRRSIRPVSGDPPPSSKISAEEIADSSPTEEVMAESTPTTTLPPHSTPRFSAKRERQLDQMRRAAASQVRSIAEKRRIEEEAAKQAEAESEADHQIPSVKQELSLWDRFLKR
ncbi:hypothetical protein B0J17DRAFT_715838 [Rhizoctonia solani]|nr:hypothetical protein B0J17DRAFT_715838 [Rhizoctonia solani]